MVDLIFVISKTNRNSVAALCGALDTRKDLLKKLNFILVKKEKVLTKIDTGKKQIVAFSFQTPDVLRIKKLLPKIKQFNPQATLIAGGPHPSGAYEHTLDMGFDYAFIGESEETLQTFLDMWLVGDNNFNRIQGLAFKQNGKVVCTGKALMVDLYKYLPVSKRFKLFTPIEITRGCPFGCYFCQTTYMFGKIRHLSIEQIVESVKVLVNHGYHSIRFVSPNILSYGSKFGLKPNLDKLEQMLLAVRNVKGVKKMYAGSFPSEVRPEFVSKAALQLIKQYSDNDNVVLGMQSGSDRMLEKMHRRHTVKQALRAIEIAIDVGFKVNVDFIFGNPRETKANEQQTIKVMKSLAKISQVRIHGHTFMPLPGTPWQMEKPGKISHRLRRFLADLDNAGKLYGDWKEQEKMAVKIHL